MARNQAVRLALAGACAIALTAVTLTTASAEALPTTPAEPQQRFSDTMTGDNLPTVQIDNGVVWDQAVVGNTVYAGGQFTQTRPAGAAKGTNLTARSNLLAYDITTGNLLPFNVPVNGAVKAVEASKDGKTLYIGGTFTQVDGQARWLFAAIDLTTGRVSPTVKPAVGGSYVNAIAVSGTNVYVGGLFTQAAGQSRKNLAAFASSGALTGWAPATDLQVDGMVTAPSGNIVVAGRFGTVNGVKAQGTALLDPGSGASLPWELNKSIDTGVINGGQSNVGSMGLSADATTIYGASWSSQPNGGGLGVGNLEGMWAADAATGKLVWMESGLGDHYDTYADGSTVYGVGHAHEMTALGGWPNFGAPDGPYQFSLALTTKAMGSNAKGGYWFNSGKPAPALVHWYPSWTAGNFTAAKQAGWTMEGNADYLAVGGEFQGVNDQAQYGLTRFAKPGSAPKKVGPRLSGTGWEAPTFTAKTGGGTVTITPNYDRDDRNLTYQLFRSGTAAPVATTTFASDPWLRTSQTVTLTDSTAASRSTYSYTVRAIDGDGNYADSRAVSGTTGDGGSGGQTSAYSSLVVSDGASLYYRLGGSGSAAAVDQAGSNNGVVGSGVTPAKTSPIVNDANTASTFDGTANGRIATGKSVSAPSDFSTEVWFRTTTTQGGKITGYGNQQTGTSTEGDRHVYMYNDGRLGFGLFTNGASMASSTKAYNDGQWHHVVASLSSTDGMKLYVDGALVATNASVKQSLATHVGYWRIGGDNLSDWPSKPTSANFAGDLDEFAVYPFALSAAQVAKHYTTGTGGAPATTAIASDTFDRADGSQWGTADEGGSWTAIKNMTIVDGRGAISMTAAGQGHTAYLSSATAADVDLSVDVSMDKAATGGGTFFTAIARHTAAGDYRVKLVENTNGTMSVTIYTLVGATQTTLASAAMPSYTYTPGQVVRLRFQVATSGTTTSLKAKAWPAANSEPAAWTTSATDSTAALRAAGQIGVDGYLSGQATNATQVIRVDNLEVVAP